MTRTEIENALFASITKIAPEAEPGRIDRSADIREELDIDSMDFLNIVVALHERLGVDIPESDYPRLFSIDSATAYLAGRLPAA
jgi:acyl carrier protein